MLEETNLSNTPAHALKLPWDTVLGKFHALIKFAAKQEADTAVIDTMVSVEDLYQEGLMKLYDCWQKWCVGQNKDMDEFGPIFRVSLFRKVKENRSDYKHINVEDEILTNLAGTHDEDVVEDISRSESLTSLMGTLESDTSRKLLKELINPSVNTLWEVHADIARKRMLKSQNKKVNIPHDNTVRMKHIQRSLGITVKQYDTAMTEIKVKSKLVFNVN